MKINYIEKKFKTNSTIKLQRELGGQFFILPGILQRKRVIYLSKRKFKPLSVGGANIFKKVCLLIKRGIYLRKYLPSIGSYFSGNRMFIPYIQKYNFIKRGKELELSREIYCLMRDNLYLSDIKRSKKILKSCGLNIIHLFKKHIYNKIRYT